MIKRWLLLVGALQGWALWALWKARELQVWPATDAPGERALLYLALALPLAIYYTQDLSELAHARRLRLLTGFAALFTLLGAYSGWAENVSLAARSGIWSTPPARPSDLAAAAVLGFVLLPLCAHRRPGRSGPAAHWTYGALYDAAWRNGLLSASSALLSGVFWIVLYAGAMLMKSIGIDFVAELIGKPIFAIPISGIVFGAAYAFGLTRGETLTAIRRFLLSIAAWLLPLLLAFSVAWVCALPFTGLAPLFKTHSAASILLWFLTLSIGFANAAYQDGTQTAPYGHRLSRLLAYAWPSLLVLVAVAGLALQRRIAQYGWSEDRVWAVFVLCLATLHTLGYALSLKRSGGVWLANIGQTNIVGALVMSLGLLWLLSPLGDARRIAVNSQMQRLLAQATPRATIDYDYLRWQAGRYGKEALEQLAAGVDHPERQEIAALAKQALARNTRYGGNGNGATALSAAEFRLRFRVVPRGAQVDDALFVAMQATAENHQGAWETACQGTAEQCLVTPVDLDNDGLQDAVVIVEKPDWRFSRALFYRQTSPGHYAYAGTFNLGNGNNPAQREKILADLEQGRIGTATPRYNDLTIGDARFSLSDQP